MRDVFEEVVEASKDVSNVKQTKIEKRSRTTILKNGKGGRERKQREGEAVGAEEGLMRNIRKGGPQECRNCGSKDWGGLQARRRVCVSRGRTEAEYQEGRARGKGQGKIDKELEGQAWIKEHSERVIFKGI